MNPSDPFRRLLHGDFSHFTQGIDVGSLWRWVKLSMVVGLVTGLLASAVFYVLEWSNAALFMRLAGHEQPVFGASHQLFDYARGPRIWWLILLLPAAGGLAAGLLLHRFDRDRDRGQGTQAMIDAYHNGGGTISSRRSALHVLTAAFTLGTGGSAGREGPMAYAGAGFASMIARRFKLTARDRRLLLLAGAAGGISALFRTPLGAALFALEIIYKEDFEAQGMFPVIVSSVTAYSVFTSFYGQGTLMSVPEGYQFIPLELFFFGIMAVAIAPFAVLWCKLDVTVGPQFFAALPAPRWLRPALGGLALGAMALVLPWIIGSGFSWIQDALRATDDPSRLLPTGYRGFGLLLLIALAKMVATVFTLGSGGSGGTLAPTLVIGGLLGGAFGLLFHEIAPSIVPAPGAFVLVGMGAFYAGTAKVPLATIILISELFGSYDLLVPLMLAIVISTLLLRHVSLYPAQVQSAAESPAHVSRYTIDVLEALQVSDYYIRSRESETVPSDMPLGDFLAHVSATAESFFVVRSPAGKLVGTVSLDHVRSVVAENEVLDFLLVGDAMTPLHSVSPGASLGTALKTIIDSGHEYAPVIEEGKTDAVLGVISHRQIAAEYSAEILRRRLDEG